MLQLLQITEKKAIRRRSNLAGLALLSTTVLSFGVSFVLALLQMFGVDVGLSTTTVNGVLTAVNPNAYILTNTLYYVAVMGIPALVGCLLLRSNGLDMNFRAPIKNSVLAGYLALGMGVCVFANVVAYGSNAVFALFSLYPVEVPTTADGTWLNWVLSLIGTAVLPAILEELLFRGVTVTLLRAAGDRTAVMVSAILFALAHGTLNQIPFAFVLGLMFAYLYIRTGSLLLPMALHFLNNALAVTVESFVPVYGEERVTVVLYAVFAALAMFGAVAAVFLRLHADRPLQALGTPENSVLPQKERYTAALLAPVMLIFAILSLLALPMNVEYDPARMENMAATEDTGKGEPPLSDGGGSESAVITWK